MMLSALALLAVLSKTQAPAADPTVSTEPAPAASVSPPATVGPAEDKGDYATTDQVESLDERLTRLEAELKAAKTQQSWASKVSLKFSGYLDFGFFWVQGNGSGVRPDVHHLVAPELQGQILGSWVLVGDPLSTAINSRGDVADVGDARAVRFDPVHVGGKPSFMVNSLNLGFRANLGDSLSVQASIDFLPRDRDLSQPDALGDLFDLKLAFARYELELSDLAWFSLDAGKVDSVIGVEYRTQDAPDRLTVTPSLVCRYTCGRPVGLRAIGRFFQRRFELALALTNGSPQTANFPFSNQTEFNRFKTVSGRLAYHFPLGRGLEVQLNGAVGPQDRQSDDSVLQFQVGAAALLEVGDFTFAAEGQLVQATGKDGNVSGLVISCGEAACLQSRSAYVLAAWKATNVLRPYARVDFRSARHRSGDQFAYVSDVLRVTGGVQAELGSYVIIKLEYTFNEELGAMSFPDDVLATSLVVRY